MAQQAREERAGIRVQPEEMEEVRGAGVGRFLSVCRRPSANASVMIAAVTASVSSAWRTPATRPAAAFRCGLPCYVCNGGLHVALYFALSLPCAMLAG
jgi:hypothetical protein